MLTAVNTPLSWIIEDKVQWRGVLLFYIIHTKRSLDVQYSLRAVRARYIDGDWHHSAAPGVLITHIRLLLVTVTMRCYWWSSALSACFVRGSVREPGRLLHRVRSISSSSSTSYFLFCPSLYTSGDTFICTSNWNNYFRSVVAVRVRHPTW